MGTTVSRLIDSAPFIEYISRQVSAVDNYPSVPLYLAPSAHPLFFESSTSYPPQSAFGVFSQKYIPKGTIFQVSFPGGYMIQDGVINFQPLMTASTSRQTFEAWHQIYNGYHNFDIIGRKTNVRPIRLSSGQYTNYYEAIVDIQPGTELYQYYGISIWIPYGGIKFSTRENLAGHVKFVECATPRCHPLYRDGLKKYTDWLRSFLEPKINIPYSDPNYLLSYDQYYSKIQCTENITEELVGSIPRGLLELFNNHHIDLLESS